MKTPVPMIVLRTSAAKLQRPIERTSCGEVVRLLSAYAECIGDAVNVVEPAGDEGNLYDATVVEADGTQALVVGGPDACRVVADLHDIVEHSAILFA
jgi:hypothetical protein